MKKAYILLLTLIPTFVLAGWGMMERGYGHMNGYGGVGMFFGMAVLLAIFIYLTVWAINQFSPTRKPNPPTDSAIEIVRTRFAKGEITETEMEQQVSKLK